MKRIALVLVVLFASFQGLARAQNCPGGICYPQQQQPAQRLPVQPYAVKVVNDFGSHTDMGSGTIVATNDGGWALVLTNNHVVSAQHGKLTIKMADGSAYDAKLIDSDPYRDLAALGIASPKGVTPTGIAAADLDPNETVWQAGYEHGGPAVTHSGRRTMVNHAKHNGSQWCPNLNFSFPVQSGASGSGIIRRDGSLAGVIWGSDGTSASAIPVSEVQAFVEKGCCQLFPRLRRPSQGVPVSPGVGIGVGVAIPLPAATPAPAPAPLPVAQQPTVAAAPAVTQADLTKLQSGLLDAIKKIPSGPKGDKGDQGATGPAGKNGVDGKQGAVGPAGPTGLAGPAGPQGSAGTPADMSVVSSLSARVAALEARAAQSPAPTAPVASATPITRFITVPATPAGN